MTRPKLILPSLSMPWGRWVEENVDSTTSSLGSQVQDSNSAGNIFASRADLIQGQIASIPSIAAIYQRSIPPFSVTRTSTGATGYVYSSPVQTFNPPRATLPYGYQVIAVMDVSGVNLPFSRSIIRTNGIENTYQHENLQPGYQTSATYSILGSGRISEGQQVSVECGVIASDTGTLTFNRASLWCVFSGSIL